VIAFDLHARERAIRDGRDHLLEHDEKRNPVGIASNPGSTGGTFYPGESPLAANGVAKRSPPS